MTIYVVETMEDYCTQLGFSTSKRTAEIKAKELRKKYGNKEFWVTPYTENKENFCKFDNY